MRAQVGTLILATSVVQLANGFFNTLIALRLAVEGFGPNKTGLVLSAYFAGFTLAAMRSGRIIDRIGHIRAYAAFAGLAVAATALMPLVVGPLVWLALRLLIGFGCAGLFVATESWLNAKVEPAQRGRVFSIYMVGTFLALAIGQLVIARVTIASSAPFNAIVVLFAASLVMVSMTRAEAPRLPPRTRLPFTHLVRAAIVAVTGVALSGLISSTFYALVPVWMYDEGISQPTIALFMLTAVLGGLLFQVPVGRLSDRVDRRKVLAALGVGLAATAIGLVLLPHSLPVMLPGAALFGGFMSTLYPVCVANAHDRLPGDRVVAVSGHLILLSGLASIVGPIIGTSVMSLAGIDGLFYFLAAAAGVLAVIAGSQALTRKGPLPLERTFEILTPQAASLAHDPVGSDG